MLVFLPNGYKSGVLKFAEPFDGIASVDVVLRQVFSRKNKIPIFNVAVIPIFRSVSKQALPSLPA